MFLMKIRMKIMKFGAKNAELNKTPKTPVDQKQKIQLLVNCWLLRGRLRLQFYLGQRYTAGV